MLIMAASAGAMLTVLKKSAEINAPAVFPTDTIYGIGAPLSSVEANKKIFSIKRRPGGFPFPILAGSLKQAEQIADFTDMGEQAEEYLSKWPGPYTYIVKSKPGIPDIYCKNGTVAVRIPDVPWIREALEIFGEPVTATSVNINKEPALNDMENILTFFGDKISLFINGKAETGRSSQIIDLSGGQIVKIR